MAAFNETIALERGMLHFGVSDTGCGLKSHQIDRLLEPFSQVDTSRTRKFGGTGLGLAISRRLARALKGDISAESTPAKGSLFRLTLDIGLATELTLFDPAAAPKATTFVSTPTLPSEFASDCRVLLVEDGPDNQRLISFLLRKAGAQVTITENGQLGVDAAIAAVESKTPFEVVLMDMQMPVLDGYQATKILRAQGYDRPIIALTAHAMEGDRKACIDAGCGDYTTKPINRTELLSLVALSHQTYSANQAADKSDAIACLE